MWCLISTNLFFGGEEERVDGQRLQTGEFSGTGRDFKLISHRSPKSRTNRQEGHSEMDEGEIINMYIRSFVFD